MSTVCPWHHLQVWVISNLLNHQVVSEHLGCLQLHGIIYATVLNIFVNISIFSLRWFISFVVVQSPCCVGLCNPTDCSTPRLPHPSISAGICSNSCQWYHPTILSSIIPFSSCPQSFPASGSFPVSHLFTSGGHSIGSSASASVLPMNIQG